jgi:hypothetical protein
VTYVDLIGEYSCTPRSPCPLPLSEEDGRLVQDDLLARLKLLPKLRSLRLSAYSFKTLLPPLLPGKLEELYLECPVWNNVFLVNKFSCLTRLELFVEVED